MNLKGPDPVKSLICSLGSVTATRAGIMTQGLAEALPSDSRTRPKGVSSSRTKVFLSTDASLPSDFAMSCPTASRAANRLMESTQSSAVTGWPSCHLSPSRRMKDHFRLSALVVYLSTICGCMRMLASGAKSMS